jgi:hypothetical protein
MSGALIAVWFSERVIMDNKDCSTSAFKEDYPASFSAPGYNSHSDLVTAGYIQIKCAWCGLIMGFKPTQGVNGVSHGICIDCIPKMIM